MLRSAPLNFPARLVIRFFKVYTFACTFQPNAGLDSTDAFNDTSTPRLIAFAAFAYTRLVRNGGCGTPYRNNMSLVLSLNMSIEPLKRSLNTVTSKPMLNDFLTSHFKSGLSSC